MTTGKRNKGDTLDMKHGLTREQFDMMIGKLDHLLSEFTGAADEWRGSAAPNSLDQSDRQTLKHHADDLIGVGNAVLAKLGFK